MRKNTSLKITLDNKITWTPAITKTTNLTYLALKRLLLTNNNKLKTLITMNIKRYIKHASDP